MENTTETTFPEFEPTKSWIPWPQWKPVSLELLHKAEKKMMSCVKTFHETKFTNIGNGVKLWTYIFGRHIPNKTPIVMVHGFAGGVGLWSLNFDSLAENRPVYAMDLLGFGKSSRMDFDRNPEIAEEQFVDSIEEFRKENEIDKMILLGHSFGGYLVSSYALKYPNNIKHLILADPWGFPDYENRVVSRPIPLWIKGIAYLLSPFNPLAVVRTAGPWGPGLIQKFRGDLGLKFAGGDEEKANNVFDYIYHCNAQNPTGETAFHRLSYRFGFARFPMIKRIGNLNESVPVTFIYGARTWMDHRCGQETQNLLPNNNVEVYSVKAAGHHVYADQPNDFHDIVNTICADID